MDTYEHHRIVILVRVRMENLWWRTRSRAPTLNGHHLCRPEEITAIQSSLRRPRLLERDTYAGARCLHAPASSQLHPCRDRSAPPLNLQTRFFPPRFHLLHASFTLVSKSTRSKCSSFTLVSKSTRCMHVGGTKGCTKKYIAVFQVQSRRRARSGPLIL